MVWRETIQVSFEIRIIHGVDKNLQILNRITTTTLSVEEDSFLGKLSNLTMRKEVGFGYLWREEEFDRRPGGAGKFQKVQVRF